MNANHPLLFDEFDIKECATTDTLKRGKKAYQNHCIHDVSLSAQHLQGTYQRANVTKAVKIAKKNGRLTGTIDGVDTRPFSAPLTALAYWYINYVNENKMHMANEPNDNKSLEPFNDIQLTLVYTANQNKVNVTLFQPATDTYCNESHFFIHSFPQLIQHYDSGTQQLLVKLNERYDESFFFKSNGVKCDGYISSHLIQLASLKVLFNEKHQKIRMTTMPIHLKITCKIVSNQVLISFFWVSKDNQVSVHIHNALQCEKTHHVIINNQCFPIQNDMHSKIALQFKSQSFQRLDISKIKPFIQKIVELRKKVGLELAIDANIQQLSRVTIKPICVVDVSYSKTGGILTISYRYNSVSIATANTTPYIIFDDFTYSERDFNAEHELKDALLRFHPSSTDNNTIAYATPYFDHVLCAIKEKTIPNMRFSASSAKDIKLSTNTIRPVMEFKVNGMALKTNVQWVDANKTPVGNAIDQHVLQGVSHYFDAKTSTLIPIEQSSLVTSLSQPLEVPLPIGIAIFIALNTTMSVKLPASISGIVGKMKAASAIPIQAPIKRILRPFQKDGLQWLLSLYDTPMNGILADDMGLGKTIQSIMLLKQTQATQLNPSLIVMPKTLLFNWQKELRAFAPELTVCLYDGPKRKKAIETFKDHDIILCSYTSLRLDIKLLKETSFHWLICDEAQYVKNRTTSTFKAIKKIKSSQQLLLTGTPLENSIGDLWSLMDIANPHYFGAFDPFESFYSNPNNQQVLKAAIAPFMLRRRKKDVVKDLPSVTIQELWATPSSDDIKSYTSFASQEWKRVEQLVKNDGLEKAKVHIFALMTKLRQWCAHPKLVTTNNDPGPKWLIFIDRLVEAVENGHKVVVFSQFIGIIDTMADELNELGIPAVSLTGQTKNRESIIETFNNDEQIRVGLFSLKAGGVGINLTSADYVFLYDPWWNPAVEQQAIDRVHRIGQERPVMVFKCLVAGTIEERMVVYQSQKKELIESIIEEQSIRHLNIDEIKALFGI